MIDALELWVTLGSAVLLVVIVFHMIFGWEYDELDDETEGMDKDR